MTPFLESINATVATSHDCDRWFPKSENGLGNSPVHRNKMRPQEYAKCPGKHSACTGTPHPRHAVPIELFRRKPEDPTSSICKECYHCRGYKNVAVAKIEKNHLARYHHSKQLDLEGKSSVMYCPSKVHGGRIKSEYNRDAVPVDRFRRIPGNPKSDMWENCLECRNHFAGNYRVLVAERVERAVQIDMVCCGRCRKFIKRSELPLTKQGEIAACCFDCTNRGMDVLDELRDCLNALKLEFILKNEASCCRCKYLYFKPEGDSLCVRRLETYLKEDGHRYVTFEGVECSVTRIIEFCKDHLELTIIEFDHLTEQEQRDRKILLPHEPFVPKHDDVTKYKSVHNMRLESKKCQNLCVVCHVIVSTERDGTITNHLGKHRQKLDYVDDLKAKGCSSCGFSWPSFPRVLDMDHINPKTKRDTLANMVNDGKYTLEDVIQECNGCRVLCKYCHKIHTRRQIDNGEI